MGIEFIDIYKDKIKIEDEVKTDTFIEKFMLKPTQRYAKSEIYIFFSNSSNEETFNES